MANKFQGNEWREVVGMDSHGKAEPTGEMAWAGGAREGHDVGPTTAFSFMETTF